MPQQLYYQGKRPWYPLDGRMGGWVSPEQVWTLWCREKFLTLPGIEPRQSSLLLYQLNNPLSLGAILLYVFTVCLATGKEVA
jgi:hypothetical protein